jgi:beta-phosphoglucomutase-like phosphatase (HAD superfamily)
VFEAGVIVRFTGRRAISGPLADRHQGASGAVVVWLAALSNNSASAVRAYLNAHDPASKVSAVAARTRPDPTILKPSPHLIKQVASALGASQSTCTVVGDSQSDIQAAHSAGVLSIGYAQTTADADRLAAAGADAVILSLADLALKLRARVADPVSSLT